MSEYQSYNKPILAANLLYAHESAEGGSCVRFFNPDDACELANEMKLTMVGDLKNFHSLKKRQLSQPFAESWVALFDILLNNQ